MPEDFVSKVFVATHNAIEDSDAQKDLEKKMSFSYWSLLGELMYPYVTCRPLLCIFFVVSESLAPVHLNCTLTF